MPPPSSENDLKRRARRRLIGAVALTLVAVIVLPLLLEDEPPPASSLAVHMAVAPKPADVSVAQPIRTPEPEVKPEPQLAAPVQHVAAVEPAKPELQVEAVKPAAKPQAVPAKTEPVNSKPPKPAPVQPPTATPDAPTQPAAAHEVFVVQLAALSDAGKAQSLKGRAAQLGLPVYTDAIGNLTRVRVGPFSTRTAAVAAAVKLAENGMSGQVLTK